MNERKISVETMVFKSISERTCSHKPIKMTDILTTDHGFDMLDTVEAVMEIESHYHIDIPDDVFEQFYRVEDIVYYLKSKGIE